ncbi:MAG: ComF family protein [Nitrospinae bacterium]|nr:ComF family protein [Nitrospinota bacterium]
MNFLSKILDILLPAKCLLCGGLHDKGMENICLTCMDKIPFIKEPSCAKCGIPFEILYSIEDNPDYLCGRCRAAPPLFDRALSACRYDDTVREIVSAYKYQNKPYIGKDLISIVFRFLKDKIAELSPELIVPVPLHIKRLKERGYDQSYILAEGVGRELNIPVSYKNLTRIRYTTPQVELSGNERLKNVKGAFSIKDEFEIKGKGILLIDDVFTTGATIRECVKVIRGAGADKVYVLTVARA